MFKIVVAVKPRSPRALSALEAEPHVEGASFVAMKALNMSNPS